MRSPQVRCALDIPSIYGLCGRDTRAAVEDTTSASEVESNSEACISSFATHVVIHMCQWPRLSPQD